MSRLFVTAIIFVIGSSIAAAADKRPSDSDLQYIKAEVRGKLVLTKDAKANASPSLQVGPVHWRLLFPENKEFVDKIRSLVGKNVVVTGEFQIVRTKPATNNTISLAYRLRVTSLTFEAPSTTTVTLRPVRPPSAEYLRKIRFYFIYMDKNKNKILGPDETTVSKRIFPAFKKLGIDVENTMTETQFIQNYAKAFLEKSKTR